MGIYDSGGVRQLNPHPQNRNATDSVKTESQEMTVKHIMRQQVAKEIAENSSKSGTWQTWGGRAGWGDGEQRTPALSTWTCLYCC